MELQLIHLRNFIMLFVAICSQKECCYLSSQKSVDYQAEVGKSTVDEVVIEVYEEINSFIFLRAVKIESTAEVTMRFEQMGFLNCTSTTDQTYIVLCL